MGRSIHAFVEFERDSLQETPFASHFEESDNRVKGDIAVFNQGEFLVGQKYVVFDAIGASPPYVVRDKAPLIPSRGLPSPISYGVSERFYCIVADPALRASDGTGEFQWEVSAEEADQWVSAGLSHFSSPVLMPGTNRLGRRRVSNPNWHSASWLTLDEIRACLQWFQVSEETIPVAFQIIIEVLHQFEMRLGAGRARLVFWFDN